MILQEILDKDEDFQKELVRRLLQQVIEEERDQEEPFFIFHLFFQYSGSIFQYFPNVKSKDCGSNFPVPLAG